MDFTRETIIEALIEVGEALRRRRKIGDIAVFGGSAMILQFDLDFVTHDVDAVTVDDLVDVSARNFPNHPLDERKRRLLGDVTARLKP